MSTIFSLDLEMVVPDGSRMTPTERATFERRVPDEEVTWDDVRAVLRDEDSVNFRFLAEDANCPACGWSVDS